MQEPAMITALMLLHLFSVQNRDPRYFVEVINPLTSTLAAHKVKTTMIREHNIPPEWFTERRELADYIMQIEVEHPKCHWTLVFVNPDNGQNVIVATKRILQCYN